MSDLQFDYFDRVTPHYGGQRLRFALDEIAADDRAGASVLDVGCGDGAVLEFVGEQRDDLTLHGIDPAAAYVELALEKGIDASIGSVLDRAALEPHAGRHDYVIMASVMHHLVETSSFIDCRVLAAMAVRNCLDLLKPDGKLFVFEPCTSPHVLNRGAYEIKRRVIQAGGNRRIGRGWVNFGAPLVAFFTPDQLESMMEAAGGRVIRTVPVNSRKLAGFATRTRIGLVVERA